MIPVPKARIQPGQSFRFTQPLGVFLPSGPGDGAHGLEHISKHLTAEVHPSPPPPIYFFKGVVELRLIDIDINVDIFRSDCVKL